MKINILSKSLLVALAGVSQCTIAEEAAFYGRLDIGMTHSKLGYTTQNGKSGTVLENNLSRLGIKGSSLISEEVEALYKVEFQVNSMTHDDKVFKPRNTYLGVKSVLGTLLVGRNDTVFKSSSGRVETFALTNAGYNSMISGQFRKSDSITYYSPQFIGLFTVNATYLMDDNYQGNDEQQYATSIVFGDQGLKSNSYYSALAYNTVGGIDSYRAVLQKKWNNFKLGGLYQNTKSQSHPSKKGNTYIVSAIYNINNVNLKMEYTNDNAGFGYYFRESVESMGVDFFKTKDVNVNSLVIGADYHLSKSTRIAAHYAIYNGEYSLNNTSAMVVLEDENVATVSIRYDF